MKMIRKTAFALLVMLLISAGAMAQSSGYKTGIGIRGGWWPGLTVKHFVSGDAAIEGILSTWGRHGGVRLTVLYEKHAQAFDAQGLMWYYGIGAHIGGHNRYKWRDRYYNDGFEFGVDGILGLEYYIREIPFTIGADIKPYINITGGGGFWDGALHVRYVF